MGTRRRGVRSSVPSSGIMVATKSGSGLVGNLGSLVPTGLVFIAVTSESSSLTVQASGSNLGSIIYIYTVQRYRKPGLGVIMFSLYNCSSGVDRLQSLISE